MIDEKELRALREEIDAMLSGKLCPHEGVRPGIRRLQDVTMRALALLLSKV